MVNEVIQSVLVLPVVTDDPGVVAGVDLVLEPVAVAGVDSVLEPGVVAGVDSILEPGVVAGVDPVDDATLLLLVALLVEIREDNVDETVYTEQSVVFITHHHLVLVPVVQVVETDGVAGAVAVVDAILLLLVALLVEIREDDVDETV